MCRTDFGVHLSSFAVTLACKTRSVEVNPPAAISNDPALATQSRQSSIGQFHRKLVVAKMKALQRLTEQVSLY